MNNPNRFLFTALVIFFTGVNIFASTYSQYVEISGRKTDVDLSDIIRPEKPVYDEIDLKKICVDITERYHSLGYTAFRISKAVLKNDGHVLIEFLEPVVDEISVSGTGSDSQALQARIYTRGAVFNEFTLSENMKQLKAELSLKRLTVDLKKLNEDKILLKVTAVKRIINGSLSAGSSPVYGAVTGILFNIASDAYVVSTGFETTAWLKNACYSKGVLSFQYKPEDSFLCRFTGYYKNSADYSDSAGTSVYKSETSAAEISAVFNRQAILTWLGISGEYSNSNQLAGFDEKILFSGITFGLEYDDKNYRIDPLDNMSAEMTLNIGRNYIEENIASRLIMKGKVSIPVAASMSLVAGLDSRYTSEDNRYFHEYVFDRSFPVRENDFVASPWRIVTEFGIMFDLFNRSLYLSPVIAEGFYDCRNRTENLYSGGLKLLFNSAYFSGEIMYSIEVEENPGSGVLSFSANAGF